MLKVSQKTNHYSKDNGKEVGANKGMFMLLISAVGYSSANITFE
jgi:hypothetical protein